ncbi:MAG: cytochrome C554 [Candidatus Riflebacteria bacterium]|nr:cytochrome C554 [Candidatus Riflebacteria bacterium]
MRFVWIGLLGLAWALGGRPASAQEREYVGVKKCTMCHNDPRKGAQFQKWSTSRHAQAWRVLGTEAAERIARPRGVQNPRKSDKCLRCHVTAYGVKASLVSEGIRSEDGVGCESCHGPGGDYAAMDVMADRRDALANGLVIPDEKVCKRCHNAEAHSPKPFVFGDRVREILHPDPTRPRR